MFWPWIANGIDRVPAAAASGITTAVTVADCPKSSVPMSIDNTPSVTVAGGPSLERLEPAETNWMSDGSVAVTTASGSSSGPPFWAVRVNVRSWPT